MFKVLGYDADGVEVSLIPRRCGGCTKIIYSIYLYLAVVIGDDGCLNGIEATARSFTCCGYETPASIGAATLAQAIEHVNTCSNHGTPQRHYRLRICRHPNVEITRNDTHWVATCPDCPGMASSTHGPPHLVTWRDDPTS